MRTPLSRTAIGRQDPVFSDVEDPSVLTSHTPLSGGVPTLITITSASSGIPSIDDVLHSVVLHDGGGLNEVVLPAGNVQTYTPSELTIWYNGELGGPGSRTTLAIKRLSDSVRLNSPSGGFTHT